MNDLLSVSVLSVTASERLRDIWCKVEISDHSRSVQVPSEPINFSGVSPTDKLKLTVSTSEGHLGVLSLRVSVLLQSSNEMDSEFTLSPRGRVRLRVEKLENYTEMTAKGPDLNSLLTESIKARESLHVQLKESAEQFRENYGKQATLLSNALDQLQDLSENLKSEKTNTNKLTYDLRKHEASVNELKNSLASAQSEVLFHAQTAASYEKYKTLLQQRDRDNEDLKTQYQSSLDEFSNCSRDQDSHNRELCDENNSLRQRILDLEKQLFTYKNNEEVLNSDIKKLHSEVAALKAQLHLLQAQRSRENELNERVIELEKTNGGLKAAFDKFKSSSDREVERLKRDFYKVRSENKDLNDLVNTVKAQLQSKDLDNFKLKAETQDLKTNVLELQEQAKLQEDYKSMVDQLSAQNCDLSKTAEEAKNKMKEAQDKVDAYEDALQEFKNQVDHLEGELRKKDGKIVELKSVIKAMKNNKDVYYPERDDPVDIAIADYINTNKPRLQVPLTREENGVYVFGTKRVLVKLEAGKLIFRVGGGYMQIEDFCEMYSAAELDKYENKLREQAQQVRKNLYGRYANGLCTEKSCSPGRTQNANGYSTFYAIQDKKTKRKKIRKQKSNKNLHED